jgi:hypothetical protein
VSGASVNDRFRRAYIGLFGFLDSSSQAWSSTCQAMRRAA